MDYKNIKIYERFPFLTKKGEAKTIKKAIDNPTLREIWFFLIKSKNIKSLQLMINDGFKIDTIDINGATIAHLCLQYKSRKLLDFAIDKKANFNQKDIFENHPIDIIFQKSYTNYFFKKIICLFDFSQIINKYQNSFIFSACHDKNLSKIKFFIKSNVNMPNNLVEQMSQAASLNNAQKNWLFLSGKEKLLRKLKRLPVKNNIQSVKI